MKNNFLLLILIGIGVFTYYREELGGIKKLKERKTAEHIFHDLKFKDVSGIKFQNTELIKGNSKFYTASKHIPVDPEKLDHVLKMLSAVKIVRVISNEEINQETKEQFFPDKKCQITFFINQQKITLILGNKLEFDRSFYMEIEKDDETKFVIAHDTSETPVVYQVANTHNSNQLYMRIKSLFLLPELFFHDMHLFKDKLARKKPDFWATMEMENIRNRSFKTFFNKKTTIPKIYSGLRYLTPYFSQVSRDILSLKGKKIFSPYSPMLLKEKLSTMRLKEAGGIERVLTLYKRYRDLSGYFITTNFEKTLYEFDHKSVGPFFLNVQNFWDKKIFASDLAYGTKEEFFELSFKNGKTFMLSIPVSKQFKIINLENNKFKPNNMAFKALFSILSVMNANYASVYNTNDKIKSSKWKKHMKFRLRFEKFTIEVCFDNGELVFINEEHKLELHYLIGDDLPFGFKSKNFFYKDVKIK